MPSDDLTHDDDLFGPPDPLGPEDPTAPSAAGSGRRRSVDLTALVAGLVFLAFGLAVLADEAQVLSFDLELRWVWPLALIGLGLAGLLSGTRRRDHEEPA